MSTGSAASMLGNTSRSTMCSTLARHNRTDVTMEGYELFRAYFTSWFLPCVILLGLFGNAVSLSVLSKFKVFQPTTSALFGSLGVADIVNLIFAAGYLWAGVTLKIELMDMGSFFCYLVPYAEAVGYWLSPWLQATISVHRMLAVRFPLRTRAWLTLRKTRIMILAVSSLVILYAVVIPFQHQWDTVCGRCKKTGDKYIIYYSHGVFGSFIPFGIMVISTTIISVLLCQASKSINSTTTNDNNSMEQSSTMRYSTRSQSSQRGRGLQHQNQHQLLKQSQRLCTSTGGPPAVTSPFHRKSAKRHSSTSRSEKRIASVLISMNVTYFLTNGAAGVFLLLRVHLVDSKDWWIWHILHRFFDVVSCLNNCTNWAFYLMSGAQYRRKFLDAIRVLQCSTLFGLTHSCFGTQRRQDIPMVYANSPRRPNAPASSIL